MSHNVTFSISFLQQVNYYHRETVNYLEDASTEDNKEEDEVYALEAPGHQKFLRMHFPFHDKDNSYSSSGVDTDKKAKTVPRRVTPPALYTIYHLTCTEGDSSFFEVKADSVMVYIIVEVYISYRLYLSWMISRF